ncbi:MAG: hypothetical protein N3G78_03455 [Desulfobacterota bacterium]|nr:hypothetical protein [Thermodesulfobacteriota bacterium]
MKQRVKKREHKTKSPVLTYYDCCWFGPAQHRVCCGGFCGPQWGR